MKYIKWRDDFNATERHLRNLRRQVNVRFGIPHPYDTIVWAEIRVWMSEDIYSLGKICVAAVHINDDKDIPHHLMDFSVLEALLKVSNAIDAWRNPESEHDFPTHKSLGLLDLSLHAATDRFE